MYQHSTVLQGKLIIKAEVHAAKGGYKVNPEDYMGLSPLQLLGFVMLEVLSSNVFWNFRISISGKQCMNS